MSLIAVHSAFNHNLISKEKAELRFYKNNIYLESGLVPKELVSFSKSSSCLYLNNFICIIIQFKLLPLIQNIPEFIINNSPHPSSFAPPPFRSDPLLSVRLSVTDGCSLAEDDFRNCFSEPLIALAVIGAATG